MNERRGLRNFILTNGYFGDNLGEHSVNHRGCTQTLVKHGQFILFSYFPLSLLSPSLSLPSVPPYTTGKTPGSRNDRRGLLATSLHSFVDRLFIGGESPGYGIRSWVKGERFRVCCRIYHHLTRFRTPRVSTLHALNRASVSPYSVSRSGPERGSAEKRPLGFTSTTNTLTPLDANLATQQNSPNERIRPSKPDSQCHVDDRFERSRSAWRPSGPRQKLMAGTKGIPTFSNSLLQAQQAAAAKIDALKKGERIN